MNEAVLSNKVASLERTVRTLRMVAVALVASQILWILMGATQQDDPKVRRFAIVDKDGKPRIQMQTDDAGHPSLVFLDENGSPRISLDLQDVGPTLHLSDAKNTSYASIQVAPGGAAFDLDDDGPYVHLNATSDKANRYSEIEVGDSIVK